jgi:BA14K-like protein
MKSLAAPSICLAAFGAVMIGGLATLYASREPPPHHFANLDAPLWTTTPTRVDPKNQNYERLPSLQAATDEGSASPVNLAGIGAIVPPDPTVTPQVEPVKQEWIADGRHIAMCQQRYRSYDAANNSYQPFDGGPRRPCVTAEAPLSVEASATESASDPHISWCSARYSSYRVSDDTYQPFSGPRRPCASPLI